MQNKTSSCLTVTPLFFCFEITGWADTGWYLGICVLWLILQKRCERRKGHWGFCCISLPEHFSMLITTLSGQWATKQRSSNVCLGYLSVAIRGMFQNCRRSQPAPSCAQHSCTRTHALSLTSYFPLLISHPSGLYIWALLYMRETPPLQREFFWAWAKGGSASPLPPCGSSKPLKLGHTSSATSSGLSLHITQGHFRDFKTPWTEFKPCNIHSFDALSSSVIFLWHL